MCFVVAAVEGGAAVDTRKEGTVAAAFVGVEFGLFDSVIADLARDCGDVNSAIDGIVLYMCGGGLTGDHFRCGGCG